MDARAWIVPFILLLVSCHREAPSERAPVLTSASECEHAVFLTPDGKRMPCDLQRARKVDEPPCENDPPFFLRGTHYDCKPRYQK